MRSAMPAASLVNSTIGILGHFRCCHAKWAWKSTRKTSARPSAAGASAPGAYVVLPVFGPRNVRDTAGLVLDVAVDPVGNVDHVPTRNSLIGPAPGQ